MESEWRDKDFLKNRWNLREEELVELVFRRIVAPYWKRPDGVYMPLSHEISSQEEGCAYHRWMNAWHACHDVRTITETDIMRELDTLYIWFRWRDIHEAEQAGTVPLEPAGKQKSEGRSIAGKVGGPTPGGPEQDARTEGE
jgi:hypothetical protein